MKNMLKEKWAKNGLERKQVYVLKKDLIKMIQKTWKGR